MSALDAVLTASELRDGGVDGHIPADWMQGRTAYGGISSAVALDAVMKLNDDLPPLRSAQISFVGPVAGECRVTATTVRASKASRFITADVTSELGFGTHALFTFSGDRDSHLDHDRLVAPDIGAPEEIEPVPPHPLRPGFTRHFDMRPRGGRRFASRQTEADYCAWVRLVEPSDAHPAIALLAIGDALPPAAMALFDTFGPISSMNWTVQFLTPRPTTDDGWWLLSARSSYARGGFSAQEMTIWNRAGQAVAHGGQGIGVYV